MNIVNEYDKAGRVTKRCYTKPSVTTSATTCSQIASNDQSTDTPSVTFQYDGKGLDAQQSPNDAKGNFLISPLVNLDPFPQDRDIMNVSHRWEFGMKAMGYEVSPNQMPNPGAMYTSGEMYNRLNPGRPTGPIVVRFSL